MAEKCPRREDTTVRNDNILVTHYRCYAPGGKSSVDLNEVLQSGCGSCRLRRLCEALPPKFVTQVSNRSERGLKRRLFNKFVKKN